MLVARARHSYRKDIDGIRAIAVSAVVLFHAAPALMPSGFFGVDVFFVISGYLISSLIFPAALQREFSFIDFYVRRARRILPALIVVITCLSAIGIFFFSRQELIEYAGQSAMALVGCSNFYFWKHTDYFATAADQEPLLMTWSLGVEEQFYVLFPFLLIIMTHLGRFYRIAALVTAVIISLSIFLYCVLHYPISAFYMLPSRGWEMAAGATLAVLHCDWPQSARFGTGASKSLGWIFAATLTTSLFIFNDITALHGAATFLPVLSTIGLLQWQDCPFNRSVLSSAPFVFVGRVSYSWYLWHWPLMALVRRASDFPPSSAMMLLVAVLSLGCGVLSWRFVEQPYRNRRGVARATLIRYAVAVSAAMMLPVLFKVTDGLPERLPQRAIDAEDAKLEGRGSCLVPYGETRVIGNTQCLPAASAVALFGDSHAAAYGPGLVEAARAEGLRVAQFTKSDCRPTPGFVPYNGSRPSHGAECAAFRDEAIKMIVMSPSIRLVLVSGYWNGSSANDFRDSSRGDRATPPATAIPEGLRSLAATFGAAGKQTVLVDDVPSPGFDVPRHLIGQALPLRDAVSRFVDGKAHVDGSAYSIDTINGTNESPIVLSRIAQSLGVTFFAPAAQLCASWVCRFEQAGRPLFYDASHLSVTGSKTIDWQPVLALNR